MDISIIVTNFNYSRFLERCLRSCLNQKVPEGQKFEVVVVDDASTDDSRHILDSYKGEISAHLLKENRGVAFAANYGIKKSRGQYFVRVDADDFISQHMICVQSLFLNMRRDYLGVSVDYFEVDKDGDNKLSYHSALEEPISCGIMYKKDLLLKEGLYNPEFRHREEKELRLRLKEKYRVGNVPIPLYRYRKHGANKTEDIGSLAAVDEVLRNRG